MDSNWTVQSTWTPTGLSSPHGLQLDCPVQWTPLQSTLIIDDMGGLGCRESPLESSGVYMDYGGDRQDLQRGTTMKGHGSYGVRCTGRVDKGMTHNRFPSGSEFGVNQRP